MKGSIKNNNDWFLASVCVRNEPANCSSKDEGARNITWVNTYLIHAKDLSEAFDKAVRIGRSEGRRYRAKAGMRKWRFVGLWDLVPVYDDLADGEEIYWTNYGKLAAGMARRRCVTKKEVLERLSPLSKHTDAANSSAECR